MTSDISAFIAPKSDQLNADDLIAGPIVVEITGIRIVGGREQPVAIEIRDVTGTPRQPWKPCKTTMRVLAFGWETTDAQRWIGRLVRLYRDPDVRFGGDTVGGIRVSGMSGIKGAFKIALAATRGKKQEHRVEKLPDPTTARPTPTGTPWTRCADAMASQLGINPVDVIAYCRASDLPDPPGANDAQLRALYADLKPGTDRRADFDAFCAGTSGATADDGAP